MLHTLWIHLFPNSRPVKLCCVYELWASHWCHSGGSVLLHRSRSSQTWTWMDWMYVWHSTAEIRLLISGTYNQRISRKWTPDAMSNMRHKSKQSKATWLFGLFICAVEKKFNTISFSSSDLKLIFTFLWSSFYCIYPLFCSLFPVLLCYYHVSRFYCCTSVVKTPCIQICKQSYYFILTLTMSIILYSILY